MIYEPAPDGHFDYAPRIFKEGCVTPDELEFEEKFRKKINGYRRSNFKRPKSKKLVAIRPAIPTYLVDRKTKEILAEYKSFREAGDSINMSLSNFSSAMIDRPINKPVLIKGKWFIRKNHYQYWLDNKE